MLNLHLTFFFLTLPILLTLHREAEGFKEQGNAFYIKKDYAEAFNYYTKAIGNYSHAILLSLPVVSLLEDTLASCINIVQLFLYRHVSKECKLLWKPGSHTNDVV